MKYILFLAFFASCVSHDSDSLDNITEAVIKKGKGVDIEITPQK